MGFKHYRLSGGEMNKYCLHCNFEMTKFEIENAVYDSKCPNCRESIISNFYSLGSTIHKRIVAGELVQNERTRIVPPILRGLKK